MARGVSPLTERSVVFVVFDDMKMLDVTGPAEVLAEANTFGAAYALGYASVSGRAVRTSIGTRLPVDTAVAGLGEVDTVVVAGGDDLVRRPVPVELAEAVRAIAPRARRLVSICTGSFVLAAAGLLDGRRATTHWRHGRLLSRAYPDVSVELDALFVEDRGVFTSAGVSAGMDLALALVEQDHGPELARDVARSLVMFMRRPGGQSQFSAPLELRPPRSSVLRGVVDLVAAEPALDHTTTSLAVVAGVSPRHLTRLFAAELGISPARFVEDTRLDRARSLLDAGYTVTAAAGAAGFGSPETMRRRFVARLGASPSQYRARFSAATDRGLDSATGVR